MDRTRAALFLDFDNVFGGLHRLDPRAALAFARRPGEWLARLAEPGPDGPGRRWLLLRCYLNPSGSLPPAPGEPRESRIWFSSFRDDLVRAGFDVVDCPRLTHTKNAADIRMVLDAADLVGEPRRCEEVVVASGDSDMTPLLHRLRAADLRTTVVSPSDAAEAFTAVADRLVTAEEVLTLVLGGEVDEDEPEPAAAAGASPVERARALVTSLYAEAEEPLLRVHLASLVKRDVPEAVATAGAADRWFGAGTFRTFLEQLALPGGRIGRDHVWDERRHGDPDLVADAAGGPPAAPPSTAPEVVAALCRTLGVPALTTATWGPVYEVLAEYAATHDFELTESTRWSRDRLAELGTPVGRTALGSVVRAVAHGGRPLHMRPAPTAGELAEAYVGNLLRRADAADRVLGEDEKEQVRRWFAG